MFPGALGCILRHPVPTRPYALQREVLRQEIDPQIPVSDAPLGAWYMCRNIEPTTFSAKAPRQESVGIGVRPESAGVSAAVYMDFRTITTTGLAVDNLFQRGEGGIIDVVKMEANG